MSKIVNYVTVFSLMFNVCTVVGAVNLTGFLVGTLDINATCAVCGELREVCFENVTSNDFCPTHTVGVEVGIEVIIGTGLTVIVTKAPLIGIKPPASSTLTIVKVKDPTFPVLTEMTEVEAPPVVVVV